MPTTVIHINSAPPGWKSNPHYQYIGRGSKWGNNYSHLPNSRAEFRVNDRDEACDRFEQDQLPKLRPYLHELKDRILVCFCKPRRCHGDTLAFAADQED